LSAADAGALGEPQRKGPSSRWPPHASMRRRQTPLPPRSPAGRRPAAGPPGRCDQHRAARWAAISPWRVSGQAAALGDLASSAIPPSASPIRARLHRCRRRSRRLISSGRTPAKPRRWPRQSRSRRSIRRGWGGSRCHHLMPWSARNPTSAHRCRAAHGIRRAGGLAARRPDRRPAQAPAGQRPVTRAASNCGGTMARCRSVQPPQIPKCGRSARCGRGSHVHRDEVAAVGW
jgi:hypothetical protein